MQAMLTTNDLGWHAAAVLIHRPWASTLRNVAGSISFQVVAGVERGEEADPVSRHDFPTEPRPAVPSVDGAEGDGSEISAVCRRPRHFHLIVTAFDRPDALLTLLESLHRADYSVLNGLQFEQQPEQQQQRYQQTQNKQAHQWE